ncbi:MAG: galactokinase [SAR324 cluster bacterium]|jgi:galactokinase|nr:galactokinase [SAR324 cluster bacterium]MEE1575055.1 galactokinase [Deltaproteobacteria bacterium]MDP6245880.1 galactokinase [SAR324 cluster bacterium]MDP6464022.1 galactokinase [SAR324 cluster bacterium]MDP7137469.1 galactokinase [SAR324 cluster bacterium]|tara:strand:+ start:3476 stop:4630 length:1155 start_codon:yes stop_codon:yes gene_type:complete
MKKESTPRQRVLEAFRDVYKENPQFLVRAAGRVNLIGEHTDYNDGFVLPIALNRATWIALSPHDSQEVHLKSLDFDESVTVPLHQKLNQDRGWQEYLKGVVNIMSREKMMLKGWHGVVAGDVPIGAGLSSSASLELALAKAFAVAGDWKWEPQKMARLCQKAENEWVGMNCGIMDQTISALGQKGHALFLDCRSLETKQVALPDSLDVAVMDTGTRHKLVDSAYNERRSQCEEAAAFFEVVALRDLSLEKLLASEKELDPLVFRRARHVVCENDRVLNFINALEGGMHEKAGQLMNESHASLRNDFEVSSEALDLITNCARQTPGCYGARMTGGGFGGCGVALVDSSKSKEFSEAMETGYKASGGKNGMIYICSASEGAEALKP